MKKLIILMFVILGTVNLKAQDTINKQDEIIDDGDSYIYPIFPNGDSTRIKFLSDNLIYPKAADDKHISGTVWIEFVVEKDGSMTDIKVVRAPKPAYDLDDEALRVINLMANKYKWTPAYLDGKPVRLRMAFPIKFTNN